MKQYLSFIMQSIDIRQIYPFISQEKTYFNHDLTHTHVTIISGTSSRLPPITAAPAAVAAAQPANILSLLLFLFSAAPRVPAVLYIMKWVCRGGRVDEKIKKARKVSNEEKGRRKKKLATF